MIEYNSIENIILECEKELNNLLFPKGKLYKPVESKYNKYLKSQKVKFCKTDESNYNKHLRSQKKYQNMYFYLAFGNHQHKSKFIKMYPKLPDFEKSNDCKYDNQIEFMENWEAHYHLLRKAFLYTGALND